MAEIEIERRRRPNLLPWLLGLLVLALAVWFFFTRREQIEDVLPDRAAIGAPAAPAAAPAAGARTG
jgi:hypothetical protein